MSKQHRSGGGKRSGKDDVELDPIFTTVHQSLEETVTHFMGHISQYLASYSEKLRAAMPHNPKACHYYYDPEPEDDAQRGASPTRAKAAQRSADGVAADTSAATAEEASGPRKVKRDHRSESPPRKVPTSPLLRRPKLDPALAAEMEASHLNMYSPVAPGVPPHAAGGDFKFPTVVTIPKPHAATEEKASTEEKPAAPSATPAVATGVGEAAATAAPVNGEVPASEEKEPEPTEKELWAKVVPPPLLLQQLAVIKAEARHLWRTFDRIHDWLALSIPAMREDDNSGVAVLGIAITEVSEIISLSKAIYALEAKFLSDRSDIEAKVVKYQGAKSYQDGLAVFDANTWDDIERGWRSLMRGVLLAHSVLAKNMKVLKEPRKRQQSHMLMTM